MVIVASLSGPGKPAEPQTTKLNRFGEGVSVALCPSRTESKAKVYLEVSTPPCADEATCAEAETCRKALAEEFVRLALARVGK